MGCWFFLCTSGRCLDTPHSFVLFFFFFLNVLIKPILMGFTQSHCQTALQTTVLDRFVFKLRQRSSVLYRKMSHIPNIAVVVVNCQTLKITFNRNQSTTGRINPNIQLTYHVDVDIHSNTEKLNCRHSFDTWNTEIDNLCGEKPRNYWLHLHVYTKELIREVTA